MFYESGVCHGANHIRPRIPKYGIKYQIMEQHTILVKIHRVALRENLVQYENLETLSQVHTINRSGRRQGMHALVVREIH